ncbi:uroporphyrinogen-III synthase [Sphingopyxis sp.]|uniref:uroporphyrinogen-III synthase n=1 Tax=Sphingopyxis sp. TaxID=1908224 RepID=UPI002588A5B8|nr:uroporphyrinogen-III synthase [Sphingopyxis sp.]
MTESLPLLVTRADPGGAATVARARALGLDARSMPLFAAHAIDWTLPDPAGFDALLVTSAQAMRLAGPGLQALAALPVHAVGAASAAAAEAAGLRVVEVGTRDGQQLLDGMTSRNYRHILWLCGLDHSALAARDAALTPLPCYAVDPVAPPADWAALIAAPAVLLAHSGRGADRIAALTEGQRGHLTLVAISPAVAARAGGDWQAIALADRPDDAAMVAQARALCHKSPRQGRAKE